MKKTILLLIAGTFLYACQPSSNTEQSVESEEATPVILAGNYGESIDAYNVEDVTVLHHKLADQDSAMSKLNGTIVQTCQKMGCWMKVAMADGDTLRVTFKDYGFFVPKSGMEGKPVVFEGLAKKEVTSIETLQHYAKDGGASEEEIALITESKQEISFIASGVMISGVDGE
jgi:hypothetical protein